MKTMKRWACFGHAVGNGTPRRAAARSVYTIGWAGLALLTATLSAAPGPVIFNPAPGSPVAADDNPGSVALPSVST
jgi:hypothetical protein